jgi:uncharacterized protein (TIGR02118 family)
MTVKVVVLYAVPEDKAGFDERYLNGHMPLVHALPGLERAEAGRIVAAADGGEKSWHRLTELYFTDMDAMQAAMGTSQGGAAADDYQKIAPPGSRMFIQVLDD